MRRLRSSRTGVVVNVDDDKVMGPEWVPADSTSAGPQASYGDLTVEKLKDEIRSRNEGRDDDDRILLTGSKSELIAGLEADD